MSRTSKTARRRLRGSDPSARPFYTAVLILTSLAAYSLFVAPSLSSGVLARVGSSVGAKGEDGFDGLARRTLSQSHECRDVHKADDQCAFVLANCDDDEAGLLSYLYFYYCSLSHAQPLAFVILVVWLGLLFTTIGIAASDFFSVNLSTIASILGLSESLAGVTFLAFGNGSPDVFSTFAAMGSNSASMAVGELIGAASFITAVVAGSMALVREFRVGRKTYVRDICFFIVAVAFTMVFLADGHLHLWECISMIGYYVFYVITVVTWHWYTTRRRARRQREALARGHVYGASHGSEELAPEPYRDDPDEEDRQVSGSNDSAGGDIAALERGPRIEIQGQPADADGANDEDDELDEHGRHVAAEVASSMRVLRPRGRRSNTTITPIRPSLVGALEFRAALAQLQRERNLALSPIRRHSDNHLDGQGDGPGENQDIPQGISSANLSRHTIAVTGPSIVTRERALSAGDIPDNPTELAPQPGDASGAQTGAVLGFPPVDQSRARTPSPTPSYKIGGSLAPPPLSGHAAPQDGTGSGTRDPGYQESTLSPLLLQIKIPGSGRRGSGSDLSTPLSPFPGFTDSPMLLTPNPHADGVSEFMLPSRTGTGQTGASRRESPYLSAPVDSPKPVRWWPYSVLPPPHILLGTLFPTLQGWNEKTIWDKFVSAISVPSIFLLVITLPVVESETHEDDAESTIADPPKLGHVGHTAPPVSMEPNGELEPETEWQRFRRSTRSQTARSSHQSSPALVAVESPNNTRSILSEMPLLAPAAPIPNLAKPVSTLPSEASGQGDEDVGSWNRWLVAVQIFMGPLFAAFILWANWQEDLEQPIRSLVKLLLYTLVGSLVLLGVLILTTSPDRRPKYHFLLCFLGFLISIAWISTIAGEVVGVLKAFGVILGISEALLGLTVFAAGNSVGDLIADITVARLGYPVMALSACFGGPLLNILLGIGIGGAWMIIKAANQKHAKHPDRPYKHKPYRVAVGGTLMVSAITLLITLVGLLVVVPMNRWVLSRKIGYGLIAMWSVSTVVNVIIELTGAWTEIA